MAAEEEDLQTVNKKWIVHLVLVEIDKRHYSGQPKNGGQVTITPRCKRQLSENIAS